MGVKTLYEYFYKLAYGDKGADKATLVNDCLDIADAQIKANKDGLAGVHTQGTDQGLDTGGANAVVVADVKDAVTKKHANTLDHSQNTDTDLEATFEATFAKKADKLSVFAATTSAELAGVISDETGTDKLVYNTSPIFVTEITAPIINLTGGQIAFPATAVPSANANTLDDYEEGDWTATLACGTSGSITLNAEYNTGTYVKIGRMVTVTGQFYISAIDSPVGNLNLNTLPFPSGNANKFVSSVSIYLGGNGFEATLATQIMGHIAKNTTSMILSRFAAGVTTAAIAGDMKINCWLAISATYFTD